jgi:hypothetical protein
MTDESRDRFSAKDIINYNDSPDNVHQGIDWTFTIVDTDAQQRHISGYRGVIVPNCGCFKKCEGLDFFVAEEAIKTLRKRFKEIYP